ncbi:STYKc [Nesidiocoris tenuis]|uniref:non-specific serine/threonine protein kinase n=1 Tax=Nesidiocoris tenuis TaxID=355587 RepID=A0ABN7ANG9_9HEMI|nr:STYKc [Nesidiocoris tenuis]
MSQTSVAVPAASGKDDFKRRYTKEKIQLLGAKLPILQEMFTVHEKIGEGTFSDVYLASLKSNVYLGNDKNRKFAVKHLIPTCSPSRVIKELKCMQEIGGQDNVVGVSLCLRNLDCIVFVMPFQRHDRFSSYVYDMDVEEAKLYMHELLVAVRRVHQFKVIHRDIKPANFLYCRSEKKFLLVDFGLAQHVEEIKAEYCDSPVDKKRKRSEDEDNADRAKRQALQSIDANIPLPAKPATPVAKKPELYNLKKNSGYTYQSILADRGSVPLIHPGLKKPLTTVDKLFAKPQAPPLSNQCNCDGKPQVCNQCLVRRNANAPRAGTPGFRPPEVLLRSPDQDTAVDIWAAGVIFLCILSRMYPFFRAPDDLTALAEIITVFGSEELKATATKLGRSIVCSEVKKPMNLETLCDKLSKKRCGPNVAPFPPEAFDLLHRLLDLDHKTRITAEAAIKHPFFATLQN